jgi:dTDP-4-dehydrorhamnose reductase
MIRLLVTGKNGQVATSLIERASVHSGIEVAAAGRPELDFEQPETVRSAILALKPDIVVNAAAYTAVDKAESERDLAFAINRDGAQAAARAAAGLGIPFIQISTDYVYPGDKAAPYVETDATGPLGVYGHSKLAGEAAVRAAHPDPLIFRTSWVYSPFGANFAKTMLRVGRERELLRVVDDQHGNPTSALDIADSLLRIAPMIAGARAEGGIYHLCGTGSTTWYGLAGFIFSESVKYGGPNPRVEPIPTSEYPTPARRPANSRMDNSAFARRFGFGLRPWTEAAAETVGRLLA